MGEKVVTAKVWQVDPDKHPRRNYSKDKTLIGFVVSKKIHKSAVKRNRIKRQMREVVRLLIKDGKIKNGFMVSVMAKPQILEAEYKDIEKSVVNVLKRARVLL